MTGSPQQPLRDIGASSREEALAQVSVGDAARLLSHFT